MVPRPWQDAATQIYLRTFETLKLPPTGGGGGHEAGQFDYSAPSICLTKAVERELALSFWQWVRAAYGVEMPTYFDKPRPGGPLPLVPNVADPTPIDLNQKRGTQILPPSLGQMLMCFERALRDGKAMPPVVSEVDRAMLAESWARIAKQRNRVAHHHVFDAEEFEQLVGHVGRVFGEPLGPSIAALKGLLSGHSAPDVATQRKPEEGAP